ncbi:MAG: sugar phosphate isomerase/epimerase [Opitutaceae bacterium]|jgi:sugar phosphate isomerase/epimerase|nr:sugar phosphate isomerase/epimerase [Opitutaceae bacterium]
MPVQRSISTLGCPALSLGEALALAARFKLDALELRALSGTLDLPALFEKTLGPPEALAAELRGGPVRIHSMDTSLVLSRADEAGRRAFLRFLPWAEALGGLPLRVFDGAAGGPDGRAAALDTLRWWNDTRAANGWRSNMVIETHDSLLTGAVILDFANAAPDGTRILWDAHHTWKKGGEPPAATWRALAGVGSHLHGKDSASRADGRAAGHAYVLPGEGEFPMHELLAVLGGDGYAGAVTLEWERLWHPDLPPLETALESAARTKWWQGTRRA